MGKRPAFCPNSTGIFPQQTGHAEAYESDKSAGTRLLGFTAASGLACLFLRRWWPRGSPVWPEWSWPCWGWNRALMASEAKNTAAPNHLQPSLGLEMIAVGAVALWLGEDALALICAVWGVFGLAAGGSRPESGPFCRRAAALFPGGNVPWRCWKPFWPWS